MSAFKHFKTSSTHRQCCSCTIWWIPPALSAYHTHLRYSRSLIILQRRSSTFETPVSRETWNMAHCLIAVNLLKHAECLSSRLLQFNTKLFHIGSLFQLPVHYKNQWLQHMRHTEYTNFRICEVNTAISLNTLGESVLEVTASSHGPVPHGGHCSFSLHTQPYAAICWHTTELVYEIFGTAVYICLR